MDIFRRRFTKRVFFDDLLERIFLDQDDSRPDLKFGRDRFLNDFFEFNRGVGRGKGDIAYSSVPSNLLQTLLGKRGL